jgi:hypothetical protein
LLCGGEKLSATKGIYRDAQTIGSATYITAKDIKEIMNKRTNFITIFLSVGFLQVSDHVHDIGKSFVKNLLLVLQVSNEIRNVVDRAFGFDALHTMLEDGLSFFLAEKHLTSNQRWLHNSERESQRGVDSMHSIK